MTTAAIEELRWKTETTGFLSPEEWEAKWGQAWLAPNTRNHQQIDLPTATNDQKRGLSREVRRTGLMTIEDEHNALLPAVVVGRTIVAIVRAPRSGEDWEQGANPVTITLDDGSKLHFGSYGYDADGCITSYEPAGERADD